MMIPIELVVHAPAAYVGQCRLLHEFPSDILNIDKTNAQDVAYCLATYSWEEGERPEIRRWYADIEDLRSRYVDLLRRIRRARRALPREEA